VEKDKPSISLMMNKSFYSFHERKKITKKKKAKLHLRASSNIIAMEG